MLTIASELEKIIDRHLPALRSISEKEMAYKPAPGKWSKKEIIGHLVDSAQNNIRRFVLAQYEDTPHIIYNQDKCVVISNYQQWNNKELIDLWRLLNKQISEILRKMPASVWQRQCRTEELHTIEWLAEDYIKHLKHHLHQVLDLEPVAYP